MPISQEKLENIANEYSGEDIDKLLGGGLLTTVSKMSGPRGIMNITHSMQRVMINNAEPPGCFTGYEKGFGNFSDGFKRADDDYRIVAMIPRHTKFPSMKFLMVIQHVLSGAYDVVEVCHYEKLSETHGYMRPKSPMLDKYPGNIIRKGEYFYKPSSLDDNGNYMYGVNAKVAYISRLDTTEDAICVSKSFAERTTFYTIEEIELNVNLNEIMLNIYGDEENYRFMPEIGDEIPDTGIIFRKRKVDFAKSASSITNSSLMTPQNNDIPYKSSGQIVDIDIYVNNIPELSSDKNRSQLLELYEDQLRYNKEVEKILGDIIKDKRNNYTYMLKHTYANAKNYVMNSTVGPTEYKWANNNGLIEFAYLSIKVAKLTKLGLGYKLVNRFAAKGVISKILDDEYMPRDVYGNVADLILSPPGVIGRANSGQLYEQELNFCASRILDYIKNKMIDKTIEEKYALYIKFINMVNPKQAEFINNKWLDSDAFEREAFVNSIINSDRIYLHQGPFHGNISLDDLEAIYDEFNIHPNYIRTRIEFEDMPNMSDRYITERDFELKKKLYTDYIIDAKKEEKNSIGIGNVYRFVQDPKKYSKDVISHNGINYFTPKESFGIGDLFRQQQQLPELISSIMEGLHMIKEMGEKLDKAKFLDPQPYLYINEKGNLVRDMRTDEKVIIAEEYIMVLKQTSDAGFSATSIGNVSQTNMPIKGRGNRKKLPENAIKFGEMEVANILRRIPAELVHRFMAERATNPEFRRKISKMLLLEDPLEMHNIPMKNEEIVNDTPARMFVEYIKALGGNFLEAGQVDINAQYDTLPIEDLNKYLEELYKDLI